MTKYTSRDYIWHETLQLAEERRDASHWNRFFGWEDVAERIDGSPSERTIRDALATMAELGNIEENRRKGKYEPLEEDD